MNSLKFTLQPSEPPAAAGNEPGIARRCTPRATALPNLPGTNGALVFPGYSETTPGAAIPFGGPQNVYQVYRRSVMDEGPSPVQVRWRLHPDPRQPRVRRVSKTPWSRWPRAAASRMRPRHLVSGQLFQFQGAVFPQGQFPCSRDANGALCCDFRLLAESAGRPACL